MSSILSGYEYDIFISYRQKDNKQDGWVTEFVNTLGNEIEATFKEDISIYFDENPHDGLRDTHDVDDSLRKKLKCLILIPIVSQTYCDPNCFAWEKEFMAFKEQAESDKFGIKITLPSGNIGSRILPIKIHELDKEDVTLFEKETKGVMRAIEFTYSEPGVNRPLSAKEVHPDKNQNGIVYRNQINKVANSIKEVITGLKDAEQLSQQKVGSLEQSDAPAAGKSQIVQEIKKRNIIRVVLAYILTAILVWNVTQILIDMMDLSRNTVQLVTLGLVLFFPIAITFAWLYEISPDGFVRTNSESARHNPYSDAQKKPLTSNAFIAALFITVIALFYLFPNTITSTDNSENLIDNSHKSIAVLPFVNMSNDPEQEFFSDGISEELINALAKFPDLKVSGRTSSFSFKGKNENMEDIGNQLGVTSILEGSVRKSGTKIRITAQLINAEDGFHLWTETYDRELKDIFAVQDEITAAIVNELKIHLVNNVELSKAQNINFEAYSLYLKARQKLALRGIENLLESRDMFEQVIDIDSTYSPAYSGLGRALSLMINYSNSDNIYIDSYNEAELMSNKALELDPSNAEAYSVLGTVKSWHSWDWDGADKDYRKSLELSPNDAEIYNFAGDHYRIIGNYKLALEMETKALELDPLHAINHWDLAGLYHEIGDGTNATKFTESAINLNNSLVSLLGPIYINTYHQMGYIDKLENLFKDYSHSADTNSLNYRLVKFSFAQIKDQKEIVLEYLNEFKLLAENGELSPLFIAEAYINLEMYNEASYWLEKAYQVRDSQLVFSGLIKLPEQYSNHPSILKALDKPELNALFELRRKNGIKISKVL